MKPQYYELVIKDIVQYRFGYHEYLRKQKEQGIKVIGYARKSKGEESLDDRTRLLRKMANNLQDRSLVDLVYASPPSSSNEKLANRNDNGVEAVEGTDGTTQKLIEYLNSSVMHIFLVYLGYAGLTTNVDDLQQFLAKDYHILVKSISWIMMKS
ncbi:predicted protein [Lichtheimia corymbifera JMRC:FSU:9682]|uniref:Uncharacterized protein n=1 Tax=Lichtheimia corymbifera JMRC:FSU:9682 TaxID=1263082 RepID=A0A068RIN5_9FUNG|nr:predicted protein [Lichtheimia corymbifera JMRC:FSU:9682]